MANKTHKTPEQLEKERKQRRTKLLEEARKPLEDVLSAVSEPTDREYGKKFNRLVNSLRKGLLHIKKQKVAGLIDNYEDAYNKAQNLVSEFVDTN